MLVVMSLFTQKYSVDMHYVIYIYKSVDSNLQKSFSLESRMIM